MIQRNNQQAKVTNRTIRRFLGFVLVLAVVQAAGVPSVRAEDWKGPSNAPDVMFGGLVGLGVLDNMAGLALMGTASKRLLEKGFFPDITNSAALEVEAGPLITHGSAAFAYSLHLRWDFQKDSTWTLFALGGLGGVISGDSLGNRFELYPRIGVGAFWNFSRVLIGRAEISHELIAVGLSVPFEF